MEREINNPHDAFFRKYYEHPGRAAEFLKHNLPADIAAGIDFSTLEPVKDSFVSEVLQSYFADLVFSCALVDGRPGSVYVLFEHKSAPAPACALQILRYMVLLWEAALGQGTPYQELPVIVPLVIYHGRRGWNGKTMREMFPDTPPWADFVPDYRLLVYDLSHMSEEDIKGDVAARAGMLLLKAMATDKPLPRVAELASLLWCALGPQSAMATIEQLFRYVFAVRRDVSRETIEKELSTVTEGETIMRSFEADFFPEAYKMGKAEGMEQGLEKGMEKGMEKGQREGEAKGIRDALLDLLQERFGPLRLSTADKVRAVHDVQVLKGLLRSVLKTESPEAFEALVDDVLGHGGH
jgi:predicted transposase YdaD